MHEVRSWALTGCLDIFTLSANVRISKWLLLGFLVGIFPGFLSPWFALGHTSRSLLGWLGLCSRRAIGHSWSHTKHHHHNYHDHNRKDGNDNHRHYYYHHHPGDLVQTILIGPLGCESWFLEWVNWEYFSNIGKGANQQHHSQTKLIIVLLCPIHSSMIKSTITINEMGGWSRCYTPTPEETIFVTILL